MSTHISYATASSNGGYQMSRTVPIKGDPSFARLVEPITRLMAQYGFEHRTNEGSSSWVATSKCPVVTLSGKTIFKLTYYGSNKPMKFGVRKDFAEVNDKFKVIKTWPIEFSVAPQQQVKFVGFEVLADEPGSDKARTQTLTRVHKLLKLFGPPLPEYEIRLDGDISAFDRQLDEI